MAREAITDKERRRRPAREPARLEFRKRVPLSDEQLEDLDTARLVTRIQAGEKKLFASLYERYFDRVYGYTRMMLNDSHEAEDATQQVFIKVLEALPRYEHRDEPFRAWLFTIVRNYSISSLQKQGRAEPVDPAGMTHDLRAAQPDNGGLEVLDWISDQDLTLFVERLPLIQRQVLLLRYVLDLEYAEIGRILSRNTDDVRAIQSRAVAFLRKRLTALGRSPRGPGRRIGILGRTRQAYVLRRRRYALHV